MPDALPTTKLAPDDRKALLASPPGEASVLTKLFRDPGIEEEFRRALPGHIGLVQFMRAALTYAGGNSKILQCTGDSILRAMLEAATLGLMLDGTLAQAHLVPFKRSWKVGNVWKSQQEAKMLLGYRGMLTLARQSREIENVESHVVYERDTFKFSLGAHSDVIHEPFIDGPQGDFRCAYTVAWLNGSNRPIPEVMGREDIDRIRDGAEAYNWAESGDKTKGGGKKNSPWHEYYEQMARKTVIRRAVNYLPMSVEAREYISRDDDVLKDAQLVGVRDAEKVTHNITADPNEDLADRIGAPADPPPPPPKPKPKVETPAPKPTPKKKPERHDWIGTPPERRTGRDRITVATHRKLQVALAVSGSSPEEFSKSCNAESLADVSETEATDHLEMLAREGILPKANHAAP